jgi:hypothetical protein
MERCLLYARLILAAWIALMRLIDFAVLITRSPIAFSKSYKSKGDRKICDRLSCNLSLEN